VPFSSMLRSECDERSCSGQCTERHPGMKTHEFINQGLAIWWEVFSTRLKCESSEFLPLGPSNLLSENATAPPHLAEAFHICKQLSVYDAKRSILNESSLVPIVASGDWKLDFENGRADKAGWVATKNGAEMVFQMSFGPSPRVAVVFTKGYESFGDVAIFMPTHPGSITLKGCCSTEHVTQGELRVINAGQNSHGFGVAPNSNGKLHMKFIKGKMEKFAVSFVASC
jgi:hypothetical protein